MKKIKLLILFIIGLQLSSHSQYSAGGGYAFYQSFNSDFTWQGIQAFVEIPNSETNTFYGRVSFMFPNRFTDVTNVTAFEFATSPQQLEVDRVSKSSFFSVDGGNRTYFLNTYDAGIAPYFTTHGRGIFGRYSESYSDFDESAYQAPFAPVGSTAVLIGFGVNVGVKYQLPIRGAITFDLGIEYVLALLDPIGYSQNEVSSISFFANLSYRFDWY